MTRTRIAALGLTLALSACGYALVGKGVVVDPSIKRIGVPMFRDPTGKARLDERITQRVVRELVKRGRFEVVPRSTDVDAVVEGELLSYRVAPVGFGSIETPGSTPAPGTTARTEARRYDVVVTAKVRYMKVGATEPIWENDAFVFREEYDMGSDPANFFDREDDAVDRIAENFARSLVAAMLEAF